MFSPLHIRSAMPEDTPALAKIYTESRRAAFHWECPDRFHPADFAPDTEGELLFLAEDARCQVLGFVSVWEPGSFIHHLFVTPSHQGRGIGRALLRHLQARFRSPLHLKCVDANVTALQFYKKVGWRELSKGIHEGQPYTLLEYSAGNP